MTRYAAALLLALSLTAAGCGDDDSPSSFSDAVERACERIEAGGVSVADGIAIVQEELASTVRPDDLGEFAVLMQNTCPEIAGVVLGTDLKNFDAGGLAD